MAVITQKQRTFLAKAGVAMPDGSYYIRNAQELSDAIRAVGRGDASHDSIRKHIITRATALKLSDQIPDNWNPDGSLKDAKPSAAHSDMQWSVDNQRELEIYTRVAEGRGIKHEDTAVRQNMSAAAAARHKGLLISFSREQALRLQAQKDRVKSGQATEFDRLDLLGLGNTPADDPVRKLAAKPVDDKMPAIHSSTTEEEYFEHFGMKGMHWGVRRSRAQLLEKADQHEKTSAIHAHLANEYGRQHKELHTKGIHSKAFKTAYGDKAPMENDGLFYLKYGRSKAQALGEVGQTVQSLHNSHARSANRHSKKAVKLREKAKTAQHSDGMVTGFVDEDDFLEHFGVKGMHWGVRNSSRGGSDHPVSADAARASASAATVRRHGTSALSNQDLQHLVNRINLEKQHSALTTAQEHHGRDVVLKFLANQGKQQLNAVANEAATAGRKKLFKVGAGLATKAVVGAGKHAAGL